MYTSRLHRNKKVLYSKNICQEHSAVSNDMVQKPEILQINKFLSEMQL